MIRFMILDFLIILDIVFSDVNTKNWTQIRRKLKNRNPIFYVFFLVGVHQKYVQK